jgi:ATP-binding cassette subfamily B (MDR/TAP) protein 1
MRYCSIQLIERFYDPLSGQVLLDGKPVNEVNIQEYRKQLALVSQEPVSKYNSEECSSDFTFTIQTLYAGTIRFNILLGAIKPESEVTEEEIEAVCRNANVLDFIKSLPKYFSNLQFERIFY